MFVFLNYNRKKSAQLFHILNMKNVNLHYKQTKLCVALVEKIQIHCPLCNSKKQKQKNLPANHTISLRDT